MGEPGGPPSMGSHRVGHDWSDLAAAAAAKEKNLKRNLSTQIIYKHKDSDRFLAENNAS